jgi:para-aminobenzoate synthetase/4-amino-4-deoxychorismate lyase
MSSEGRVREPPVMHEFSLLETMRIDRGIAIRRDRHVGRMALSARHFGRSCDLEQAKMTLDQACLEHATGEWRARLVLEPDGRFLVSCTEYSRSRERAWRVAVAESPVDETDPFLFHKTTNRSVYEAAQLARPDVDDVLLWNRRSELTESTRTNVVVEICRTRFTPPQSCGLLNGTFRAELLESGVIKERVIPVSELRSASTVWLINSLREWINVVIVS